MRWADISEIVGGYVLKDRLPPDAVNPLEMHPSYAHIVTMKREGAEMPDIVSKDFSAVDACLHAVERVNGTMKNPLDYLQILKKAALLEKTRVDVAKVLKRLENGEEVEAADLVAAADKLERGYSRWVPLSEVAPQTAKFVKTGYEPIDKHTGGLPYACVSIIGGTPGIGKTTLGLEIVSDMMQLPANKKKRAAIISLEMTIGQIHQRWIELGDMPKEAKDRILTNRIFNIHELCAAVTELAARESLAVIMIDFADLIVEGEQSESAMGVIYRNLELLATKTEVPILLICQLNRQMYNGGLPRIYHIRYSGLAEATARLILLTYNPTAVMIGFEADKSPLPMVGEGMAYILVGKSNFGYKEGGPGAILVDWEGEKGWGRKSKGYTRLHI